jgi:hypothetical protein
VRQTDGERREGRWTRVKVRPIALVAASALACGGMVAATSTGSQAQQRSYDAPSSTSSPLMLRDHPGARAICRPEYPYPGCTTVQMAGFEAGTKKKAKRSYKKVRWGQKRDAFKKVGPRANRILKRAYRHARARWAARHPDQRLAIGSWRSFRRNLSDGGCTSMGWMSSISFWCHFNRAFNERIVNRAGRVIGRAGLVCGGSALATSAGAAIGTRIVMVALSARLAAAAGVAGCISALHSRYFSRLYD